MYNNPRLKKIRYNIDPTKSRKYKNFLFGRSMVISENLPSEKRAILSYATIFFGRVAFIL